MFSGGGASSRKIGTKKKNDGTKSERPVERAVLASSGRSSPVSSQKKDWKELGKDFPRATVGGSGRGYVTDSQSIVAAAAAVASFSEGMKTVCQPFC